jgi:hypothetical protein
MSKGRVSQKQTEEDAGHSRKWIVNDSRPGIGAYARDLLDARRERDEKRAALRLLAREIDAGRLDCQCGDLNCQHVAITDGLLAAILGCYDAARAAGGGEDE